MHSNQPPPASCTDTASPNRSDAACTRGFTFIEMIVGLAIMALVASAVTPSLIGMLDNKRRGVATTAFTTLGDAVSRFTTDVGEYPGQLTQLTTQIAGQLDVCGAAYTTGEQGSWAGPYLTRVVPTTGLPIGIGKARNQLTRYPNTLAPTHIILTVDSVLIEDALAVNREIDADGDDGAANAIRWTTLSAADGLVTLGYWGPIQDLC